MCYASGFAESGDVELQAELVRRAGELPILGPNCYGYINALDGIALWPDEHGCRPVKHGVGIISQSGNVGINLTMQQRGLNMAYMVTVGNQAGGGVEDALQSFIDEGYNHFEYLMFSEGEESPDTVKKALSKDERANGRLWIKGGQSDELKNIDKYQLYRGCYRSYRVSRMQSPLLQIGKTQWATALFLPVELFRGASNTVVWNKTQRRIAREV